MLVSRCFNHLMGVFAHGNFEIVSCRGSCMPRSEKAFGSAVNSVRAFSSEWAVRLLPHLHAVVGDDDDQLIVRQDLHDVAGSDGASRSCCSAIGGVSVWPGAIGIGSVASIVVDAQHPGPAVGEVHAGRISPMCPASHHLSSRTERWGAHFLLALSRQAMRQAGRAVTARFQDCVKALGTPTCPFGASNEVLMRFSETKFDLAKVHSELQLRWSRR